LSKLLTTNAAIIQGPTSTTKRDVIVPSPSVTGILILFYLISYCLHSANVTVCTFVFSSADFLKNNYERYFDET